MSDNNEWGSNLSFILAMIGSAVGLGNIWRYPYVLYSNGGGAFYIPYLVAILIMGIPFLILEYGVGYNFKSSFAKAITKINSKYEYLGWFLPVAVFMIMIYYSAILGWDGIYIILRGKHIIHYVLNFSCFLIFTSFPASFSKNTNFNQVNFKIF